MTRSFFEIPYYHAYISPALAEHLLVRARPVAGVPGLTQVGDGGGLETPESLRFLANLYQELKPHLGRVLKQRILDRRFIDERTRACAQLNRDLNRGIRDSDYQTILGLEDGAGRVVFGPHSPGYCRAGGAPVAPLPEYLQGPHVTLFGPPDSAKMAINAMNAYHRKLPTEPPVVAELLGSLRASPMWGADDEDSKTPLRADLVDAGVNLSRCFEGSISLKEGEKSYALAADHLSLPIKRFPGLALPSTFLFHERNPIPLHLYDFALHLFRNWHDPRALVFYVPKLENEEEAAYIHAMIAAAERRIRELHPEYQQGTIRLMIVLENPRAILRAHEIMDALHPYFAGASLGWHDYLASTARIFKEDSHYRIPVKADPNIVIKYIKASHDLLAEVVGSRGGIKVGGMYGILPLAGHEMSLQITLRGFFKDVITQMKRQLTGFWVAHPDFVRLGLAIVEAWKRHEKGESTSLRSLVSGLLQGEYAQDVLSFIEREDIQGLDLNDPSYVRSLIVADIEESDYIPNHHPDEIRYNVFQSLQYLTDWLSGNGCVALPTVIDGVPVRVMDDLATAERSRWEVWHELRHGRFSVEDFVRIAHEEMNFIRRDLSDEKKIVQVKWDARTAKWYPIALKLMLKLMTDAEPVEFATELLMPFTVEEIRESPDPWKKALELDSQHFGLDSHVSAYEHYFEICGVERFAREMALSPVEDRALAEGIVRSFSREEVLSAASFHGDIGQSRKTLDARAASEQARVGDGEDEVKLELRRLGQDYVEKFGFKFLISAQGKSGAELLEQLQLRIHRSHEEELNAARDALWEITRKRMLTSHSGVLESFEELRMHHGIAGASIALNLRGHTQVLSLGECVKGKSPVQADTPFELASLSKTLAAAFAMEYFRDRGIPLETPVNSLFRNAGLDFRLVSAGDPTWADQVTLEHLINHSALNLHYVKGTPASEKRPPLAELLQGRHGYEPVRVIHEPGSRFQYSGGGFLVLEHLIEVLEKRPASEVIHSWLKTAGISEISFDSEAGACAHGYYDDGREVQGSRLNFPGFAAGAIGTARQTARFLRCLTDAFHTLEGVPGISHDTAVQMLHGSDRGCRDFMGCRMGLGVFVAEAGENRLAIHQGANEGFRALYVQCFAGPDRGKGFVIFCNGDNRSVLFIAEVAQQLFRSLGLRGIDYSRFRNEFDFKGLAQEQIVNLGYKSLLFDAFLPDLPEEILVKGERDPLAKYNKAVGSRILSVTNQMFARAENLISPYLPIFDPELFGRQGKIMDSWETVRHNPMGVDTLVLELPEPTEVHYLSLSTKFHDGNQVEHVRIQGRAAGGEWVEILPKTSMQGHALFQKDLRAETASRIVFSQIQVEVFPDGGLSRLGLYRDLPADVALQFLPEPKCERFPDRIPQSHKPLSIPYSADEEEMRKNLRRVPRKRVDFAGVAFGGKMVKATNEHYGPASQVVSPFPPLHMFDGLESARSRKPGHFEEVILRLGQAIRLDRVVFDFTYFVNNNPVAVSIEGRLGEEWVTLVEKTCVKAFAGNMKSVLIRDEREFQELRVRTFPDGGVNRIRVYAATQG